MLKFISDNNHYSEVVELAMKAKHTLWIGTADIKDMIVKQEPRYLHKHKIRMARTIVEQVRVTQAYALIHWRYSESFHSLCLN